MKELCIRCGRETEYDTNAPITLRRYYIEGSGQLCSECWRELYEKGEPYVARIAERGCYPHKENRGKD